MRGSNGKVMEHCSAKERSNLIHIEPEIIWHSDSKEKERGRLGNIEWLFFSENANGVEATFV